MKILKYIFLLIILAAVALTVFVATQSNEYTVKEERLVNIAKPILYNYINDYNNWSEIDILAQADSATTYTYTEKTSGKGAAAHWKNTDTAGKIQTVEAIAYDTIIQTAYSGTNASEIRWIFKDTLKSTKVTVEVKGKLSFTEKAYALLNNGTENKIEKAVEKGLARIDNYLVKELNNYTIEVNGKALKKGAYYLGHSIKETDRSSIYKNMVNTLPKLMDFAKSNNIAVSGAPFVLYNSNYSKPQDSIYYTICIPIKEEIFTAVGSEFEGGSLESFAAVKTTLKGDHAHLQEAWITTNNYITEKGLAINPEGRYIEVYKNNIQQSRSPSRWVTEIYFPIGKSGDALVNPAGNSNQNPDVSNEPKTTVPNQHRQVPANRVRHEEPRNITPARANDDTDGTERRQEEEE